MYVLGIWRGLGLKGSLREKIFQVVRDLKRDKATDSDGFTIAFYHHCWIVVEKDVLVVIEEFFNIVSLKNILMLLLLL